MPNALKHYELNEVGRSRLASWVVAESGRLGLSGLARRLGVTHATVSAWRDRKNGKIKPESLRAIAEYRGEAIEQSQRWLEARSPTLAVRVLARKDLLAWCETATLDDLLWLMGECLERLRTRMSAFLAPDRIFFLEDEGVSANDLRSWLQAQLGSISESDFLSAAIWDEVDRARMQRFLDGEDDAIDLEEDAPTIASAITLATGKRVSWRDVRKQYGQKNPRSPA